MALNIKNREVVRLVEDIARLTGETKTEAIRRALVERKERLALRLAGSEREDRLKRFFETEVWPTIHDEVRGQRLSREEEDALLGYGPEGV